MSLTREDLLDQLSGYLGEDEVKKIRLKMDANIAQTEPEELSLKFLLRKIIDMSCRIKNLEDGNASLVNKLEELESETDGRIDKVKEDISEVEDSLDNLDLDDFDDFTNLKETVESLENQDMDEIKEALKEMAKAINNIL